jgi:hypothetical protein
MRGSRFGELEQVLTQVLTCVAQISKQAAISFTHGGQQECDAAGIVPDFNGRIGDPQRAEFSATICDDAVEPCIGGGLVNALGRAQKQCGFISADGLTGLSLIVCHPTDLIVSAARQWAAHSIKTKRNPQHRRSARFVSQIGGIMKKTPSKTGQV